MASITIVTTIAAATAITTIPKPIPSSHCPEVDISVTMPLTPVHPVLLVW